MTTNNGTTTERKTLKSQLDRFDAVLDGLAEGLNDAVAAAVRQTVDQTVREAIQDCFRAQASDPALATTLRGICPPPAELVFDSAPIRPAERPWFSALRNLLTHLHRRASQRWQQTRILAALVWHYCRRMLAVLLVIVLLGLAGYLAGPVLCGAFIAGLLASAGVAAAWRRWCRRPSVLASQGDTTCPTPELAAATTATTAAV